MTFCVGINTPWLVLRARFHTVVKATENSRLVASTISGCENRNLICTACNTESRAACSPDLQQNVHITNRPSWYYDGRLTFAAYIRGQVRAWWWRRLVMAACFIIGLYTVAQKDASWRWMNEWMKSHDERAQLTSYYKSSVETLINLQINTPLRQPLSAMQ